MFNTTRKKRLSKHDIVFSTPFRQGIGLMFNHARKDHAYLFPLRRPKIVPLTMLFVFTPIDVLYTRRGRVVDLIHDFRPFTNYTPRVKANLVVELPKGTLYRTDTRIGDAVKA
ncbi:MAG: DUF192 domain-containing protein [archaeon]